MKKYLFSMMCIGLLCSCAGKAEISVSSVSDEISVTESITETVKTESLSAETISRLSYYIDEDYLEILYDDNHIQTIQCDTILKESDITCEDFDFDGYDDLFIPSKLGVPNRPGTYYHYNTETQLFEIWKEISELKVCAQTDPDNKTLSQTITGSAAYHKTTVYKWSGSQLLPVSREIQYSIGDDILIDSYEYDENSSEILIKREKALFDENNYWAGTEEIEIINTMSFIVNDDYINVIRNEQVVQTLDNTPFNENMLLSEDYNFDGYEDLFVITDIHDVKLSGVYYKFNSQTSLFEEWDELNNLGHTLDIGVSSNSSSDKLLSYSINTSCEHDTYVYKWQNEDLILIEIRKNYIDQEKNTAFTDIYYIDSEGNETLIDSNERNLNENPLDFD